MKLLYVSGSLGLGHITRDLAIARALRRRKPGIDIWWLAGEPARSMLQRAGEHLHPQASAYRSDTLVAESVAREGQLNVPAYAFKAGREWLGNVRVVRRALREGSFDVLVGDETYEIMVAQEFRLYTVPVPFVMLYDFVGLDAMTGRLAERLGVYFWNLVWSADRPIFAKGNSHGVFIGEPEDIPGIRFGPLLPDRRQHARRCYEFVGYILPFDPGAFRDRAGVRSDLGYGPEPLVVCSGGGTSVGRGLLELCGQAYPLLQQKLPGLHLVLVCGPRITPGSLHVPAGIDVRGFVPDLYKHLAASDLAVVQAGGTTTLELTALQRPFIYFPLEGHCEQQVTVAGRLARHRAGIKMAFSATTPAGLADAIARHLGATVSYPPVPAGGADRVADIVLRQAGAAPGVAPMAA
jgi:UDP-N-acetylglucosamine:LPS N-acetylglucosamine transferase